MNIILNLKTYYTSSLIQQKLVVLIIKFTLFHIKQFLAQT